MPEIESTSENDLIVRAVHEGIAEICEKPGCSYKSRIIVAALLRFGIILDINISCRKEIILICPYLKANAKDRLTELMKQN